MSALELSAVDFAYGSRVVLRGLSLEVKPAEVVALLGPSGSGKSTLLRLLLGFEAPRAGAVLIAGDIVSRDGRVLVPPEERRLAVVFQDLALWPHLTVREHLAFGLEAQRVPRDEQRARISLLLERLGLADAAARYPRELSGGERQRVAIARALVLKPRAVLLDEPLSNLDLRLKRDLLVLFRELFAEEQCSALYVTHELREAAALATRIVVLEEGRVTQDGSLESLRSAPESEFVRGLVEEFG
jgi:iron(III) transport system ATP-binding protein